MKTESAVQLGIVLGVALVIYLLWSKIKALFGDAYNAVADAARAADAAANKAGKSFYDSATAGDRPSPEQSAAIADANTVLADPNASVDDKARAAALLATMQSNKKEY